MECRLSRGVNLPILKYPRCLGAKPPNFCLSGSLLGMEIPGNKFGGVGDEPLRRIFGPHVKKFVMGGGLMELCTISRAGGCVPTWACFDVGRF